MYVCICNAITEKQIRQAAAAGVTSLVGLQMELGVATGCGKCGETALSILHEGGRQTRRTEPLLYRPALA